MVFQAFDDDKGDEDAQVSFVLNKPVQSIYIDNTTGALHLKGDFTINQDNKGHIIVEIIAQNYRPFTGAEIWPVQTVNVILEVNGCEFIIIC